MTDGELIVGRLLTEDARIIEILSSPPAEEVLELDKSRVKTRRPHELSRMPQGALETLKQGEILDLMAYLLSGGDAAAAPFK